MPTVLPFRLWDDEFYSISTGDGLILLSGVGGGLIFNSKTDYGKSYGITGSLAAVYRLMMIIHDGVSSIYAAPTTMPECNMAALENYLSVAVLHYFINTALSSTVLTPKRNYCTLANQGDERAKGRTLSVIWLSGGLSGNIGHLTDP